jgi:hypothetical protein
MSKINIPETYGECVTLCFAGDVLGEAAFGDEERHCLSAIAREPTVALRLRYHHVAEALQPIPVEPERVRRLLKEVSVRPYSPSRAALPTVPYSSHSLLREATGAPKARGAFRA